MTVQSGADGAIALIGDCGLEDAEPLLQRLLADPGAVVDLRRCDRLHTALVQILLAARAHIQGPASPGFMQDVVEPLLNRQ